MKKSIAASVAVITGLVLALPASASAGEVNRIAKQECKQERNSEPAEFGAEWGGTNAKAVNRCTRTERREAARDCRAERATEPSEFAFEYGTGKGAMKRCKIDELR